MQNLLAVHYRKFTLTLEFVGFFFNKLILAALMNIYFESIVKFHFENKVDLQIELFVFYTPLNRGFVWNSTVYLSCLSNRYFHLYDRFFFTWFKVIESS